MIRNTIVSLVLLVAVLLLPRTTLGMGPENVLLVVNGNSESSITLANHYIQLRGIPAKNVLYINTVDDSKELLQMTSFKIRILDPIFDFIDQNSLKIDCIVYSSGFPTAIDVKADQKFFLRTIRDEVGLVKAKELSKFFNPKVSITSLTFMASSP